MTFCGKKSDELRMRENELGKTYQDFLQTLNKQEAKDSKEQ